MAFYRGCMPASVHPTEGGTAPDGVFRRVCRFHDEVIQEIFRESIAMRTATIAMIRLPAVWRLKEGSATKGFLDILTFFGSASIFGQIEYGWEKIWLKNLPLETK